MIQVSILSLKKNVHEIVGIWIVEWRQPTDVGVGTSVGRGISVTQTIAAQRRKEAT